MWSVSFVWEESALVSAHNDVISTIRVNLSYGISVHFSLDTVTHTEYCYCFLPRTKKILPKRQLNKQINNNVK